MVKLPRMGRPPFLKPHHVRKTTLVEIVEEPYVRSAEESRFESLGAMRLLGWSAQANSTLGASTLPLGTG
jgi:hypothetical protein